MRKNLDERKRLFNSEDFFILPHLVIKANHLTKKDIKNIKNFVNQKIGGVSLIVSIGMAIMTIIVFIISSISTGGNVTSEYGLASLIGSISSFVACVISATFAFLALAIEKKKYLFNRIAIDILFFGLTAYTLLSFYADASQGFVSVGKGISAAVIPFIILLMLQQAFFTDSFILNTLLSGGLITLTFFCLNQYNIVSWHYYCIIALAYPLAAHVIRSFLFYAETQRYCQILLNERLYNTATYDELTRCKNRFALKEYLDRNTKRWVKEESIVLIIIFDIDDFKVYNDKLSHSAGDFCLRTICDGIRNEFPSPDLDFFRYGGEEFLLFFELEHAKEAFDIIERVRKSTLSLKIKMPEGSTSEFVTISVGGRILKVLPDFQFNNEMQKADAYLYQAKNSGKNLSCLNGKIIDK